jgi:hypothetical protein
VCVRDAHGRGHGGKWSVRRVALHPIVKVGPVDQRGEIHVRRRPGLKRDQLRGPGGHAQAGISSSVYPARESVEQGGEFLGKLHEFAQGGFLILGERETLQQAGDDVGQAAKLCARLRSIFGAFDDRFLDLLEAFPDFAERFEVGHCWVGGAAQTQHLKACPDRDGTDVWSQTLSDQNPTTATAARPP